MQQPSLAMAGLLGSVSALIVFSGGGQRLRQHSEKNF